MLTSFLFAFGVYFLIELIEFKTGELDNYSYLAFGIALGCVGLLLSFFYPMVDVIASVVGVFSARVIVKEVVLKLNK